jgi:hypothetical protein
MQRYNENNYMGLNPFQAGSYNVDKLIDRMRESSKIMGSRYELLRIAIVIEWGCRRKYIVL